MTPSRMGRRATMSPGVFQHLLRLGAHGHDLLRAALHRDHRGLAEDDPLAARVDECAAGSQIYAEIR